MANEKAMNAIKKASIHILVSKSSIFLWERPCFFVCCLFLFLRPSQLQLTGETGTRGPWEKSSCGAKENEKEGRERGGRRGTKNRA